MPNEKKKYNLAFGRSGVLSPDPVTEINRQNWVDSQERKRKRDEEIEELKHTAEKNKLDAEIKGEEKEKMAKLEKEKAEVEQENAELQKEIERKEIEKVNIELGGKIDQLKQSLESGASKKSIGEQIADIKQAAADMGLGGSKFSEIQEALALVEKLRPNKGLAEQVKEAKELLEPFQKEKTGELPAEISLKMKEMDTNLQLRMEEMKDERARLDREWQLQLQKWQEERVDKKTLLEAEISAKREGNQLLSDGIQKLGEVITAARGGSVGAGGVAGVASRVIEAGEGESGEILCSAPGCGTVVPISGVATDVVCAGCGTKYNIKRVAKVVIPKAEAPV